MSWETGHASIGYASYAAIAGILALAFGKVLVVVFQYMDVRMAPTLLKILFVAWALVIGSAICLLWWGWDFRLLENSCAANDPEGAVRACLSFCISGIES